jgi:hypothetical protein
MAYLCRYKSGIFTFGTCLLPSGKRLEVRRSLKKARSIFSLASLFRRLLGGRGGIRGCGRCSCGECWEASAAKFKDLLLASDRSVDHDGEQLSEVGRMLFDWLEGRAESVTNVGFSPY